MDNSRDVEDKIRLHTVKADKANNSREKADENDLEDNCRDVTDKID